MRLAQRAPDPCTSTRVMMVGVLLRSVRIFGSFVWLGVGSAKMALSRPAHQPSPGCYATGNANHWAAEFGYNHAFEVYC